MPTAIVQLSDQANQIINIVKAKYGFRDKSQAINRLVIEFGMELLEPELRPEYIEKLKRIELEKSIHVKDVDSYFSKLKK